PRPAGESPESRPPHRSQRARHPRWLESPAQGGACDLRRCGSRPAVSSPQDPQLLEYLSDRQRPWAQAILRRAYQSTDLKTAQRLLLDLARRLETEHPSAAESVREGLDETLTVLTLNLSARLRRSLATTNAVESLLSRTRHVKRNVKRWRSGQMMLRWVAAGVLEAVKGFRRVKGYADMPTLVAALGARDRQLGLSVAQEERQIA